MKADSGVRHRNRSIICLIIASLFYVLAVIHGSSGIRGTDQFWYLADVESLVAGNGPISNHYFPGLLLRNDVPVTAELPLNYFVHNGPLLYIAAFVARFQDPYHAWILINVLSHIVVAVSIFLISRRFVPTDLSMFVCSLYIVSPLAVWLSVNVLREAYISALLAVALTGFVYAHVSQGQSNDRFSRSVPISAFAASLIALLAGIFSHPMFFVLCIAYSVFLVLNYWQSSNRSVFIIVAVLIVVLAYATKSTVKTWFPNNSSGGLSLGLFPPGSNMMFYFSDAVSNFSPQLFVQKIVHAVRVQFVGLTTTPLLIFTNIALISFVYLAVRHFTKYRPLLFAFAICLALHCAILILHQNQVRYAQILSVVVFTLLSLVTFEVFYKYKRFLLFSALTFGIASMGVSGSLVNRSHHDGLYRQSELERLTNQFSFMSGSSRVMTLDDGYKASFSAYLLRPRKTLTIVPSALPEEKIEYLVEVFDPEYAISTMPLHEQYSKQFDEIKRLENTVLGDIWIYRVKAN